MAFIFVVSMLRRVVAHFMTSVVAEGTPLYFLPQSSGSLPFILVLGDFAARP